MIICIIRIWFKELFIITFDDAFFSTGTGLERVEVVGPEPGLLWASLKALDRRAGDGTAARLIGWLWMWCTSAKRTRKKKGRQGLRP